jgi:SAM-dependent methyltransferase
VTSDTRDIAAYEAAYESSDFEVVQAEMRKRIVVGLIERTGARRILEVGCGADAIFNHLSDFESCVVVEPGSRFADKARTDASGDPRVNIVHGLLEDVSDQLVSRAFDLILVSGLLHELSHPEDILRAVRPLCSALTVVHVNVPRQKRLQQAHTFDISGLRTLCEREGFTEIDSGSYFIKPFSHAQMAQLQSTGFLDERMLDGLFGLEKHLPGLGSEIFINMRAA